MGGGGEGGARDRDRFTRYSERERERENGTTQQLCHFHIMHNIRKSQAKYAKE